MHYTPVWEFGVFPGGSVASGLPFACGLLRAMLFFFFASTSWVFWIRAEALLQFWTSLASWDAASRCRQVQILWKSFAFAL